MGEGVTCLVVASMEHEGVGEGPHCPTGEVEHCCSHPVDAPVHWNLQNPEKISTNRSDSISICIQ